MLHIVPVLNISQVYLSCEIAYSSDELFKG